jgi:hypothetical protein
MSEKKKRKYDKRSSWWTYFEEVIKGDEATCIVAGCEHTKVEFKGSITCLKRHMEKYHKDVLEEKGFYSVESIDRTFSSHERKEIAKYTMLMMIMENRPFSMIHKLMMEKIQRN